MQVLIIQSVKAQFIPCRVQQQQMQHQSYGPAAEQEFSAMQQH